MLILLLRTSRTIVINFIVQVRIILPVFTIFWAEPNAVQVVYIQYDNNWCARTLRASSSHPYSPQMYLFLLVVNGFIVKN